MLKLRTILLYDYLYYILTLMVLVYSICITNFKPYQSIYNTNSKKVTGYVTDQIIDGNKLSLEVKSKEKVMVSYYFKTKEEKDNFKIKLGDYLNITGEMGNPPQNTVFNLFNYQKYLASKGIYKIMKATKIEKIKENYRIRYKIKQNIMARINNIEKSKGYIRALILGDMDYVNGSINKTYQFNGVSHLFAISGSHIAFISLVLLFVLKKIKIEETKRYIIVISFLFFYMFLTGYTGSVLRATIFFFFLSINKIYYFNVKTINVLLLTFCALVICIPSLIYDVGFQFSFGISLYLILFQSLITKFKNKIMQLLIVSTIAFLIGIPICCYNFFQINLLSPLINLFFVPFVTFILFPGVLITFLFPFLDPVLFILIKLMENLSLFLNNIKIGQVILSKPNLWVIILYYFLITLILINMKNNKYKPILYLILLLFIHNHDNYFYCYPTVTFIDVGQGDAILINLPYNKGTLLIDTGGKLAYKEEKWKRQNKNYTIGRDTIIPYLKSIGIKHLDYLILTHGDADHMGESMSITEGFKVKKVIFNKGSFNDLEKKLSSKLKDKKITYAKAKAGDIIKIDKYKFYFLNPSENIEENANSLVLYTILNNHKVLLMGDSPEKTESKITNTYNISNVDILKLGHHGSITSSSESFLRIMNPKYAVIQVGLKNNFGHPHKNIIKRLKMYHIKTYLTSINGTIKFSLIKDDVTIQTAIS